MQDLGSFIGEAVPYIIPYGKAVGTAGKAIKGTVKAYKGAVAVKDIIESATTVVDGYQSLADGAILLGASKIALGAAGLFPGVPGGGGRKLGVGPTPLRPAKIIKPVRETVVAETKTVGAGLRAPLKKGGTSTANTRRFWTDTVEFQGSKVYQRNDLIDPARVDSNGLTNLQRMKEGLAPFGPDGKPLHLHHMLQTQNGPIAEITETLHKQNSRIIHINPSTMPSGIDRGAFNAWRVQYWINRAKDFM